MFPISSKPSVNEIFVRPFKQEYYEQKIRAIVYIAQDIV